MDKHYLPASRVVSVNGAVVSKIENLNIKIIVNKNYILKNSVATSEII